MDCVSAGCRAIVYLLQVGDDLFQSLINRLVTARKPTLCGRLGNNQIIVET